MSTAKHFPGYGGITFDPENDRLAVESTIPEYSQFQVAVEAGPEFVMSVVDVIYTPIDENLAFSISPSGIHLLRNSLAGDYLVISDDLASNTMIERYGMSDTITLAVKAGVDVLLVCHSPYPLEAYNYVSSAVQTGEITEAEINDSASKIIQRKQEYFYGQ